MYKRTKQENIFSETAFLDSSLLCPLKPVGRASPPIVTSVGNVYAAQDWTPLHLAPPPRMLALCPLAELCPAEKQTFVLYLRSHVPCAFTSPTYLLTFSSSVSPWAATKGGPPHPPPASPLVSWHFLIKCHLGKDRKETK